MSLEKVEPVKVNEIFVCPDCGCDNFRAGPQGGLSRNYECVGCETRWNVMGSDIPWERISTIWERLETKHGA